MLTELPNAIDWGDVGRVVVLALVLSLLGDAVSQLAGGPYRSGRGIAA